MKDTCIGDDIVIVDDAVPLAAFYFMKRIIERDDFNWKFISNSAFDQTYITHDDNTNQYSFSHPCDENSFIYGVCIQALLSSFSKTSLPWPQSVYRVRIGMHTSNDQKVVNTPHVDMATPQPDGSLRFDPHTTALLYLTDSDGETILYDRNCIVGEDVRSVVDKNVSDVKQIKIQCRENRVVFFNGSRLHSSTRQTTPARRIVINYNYI